MAQTGPWISSVHRIVGIPGVDFTLAIKSTPMDFVLPNNVHEVKLNDVSWYYVCLKCPRREDETDYKRLESAWSRSSTNVRSTIKKHLIAKNCGGQSLSGMPYNFLEFLQRMVANDLWRTELLAELRERETVPTSLPAPAMPVTLQAASAMQPLRVQTDIQPVYVPLAQPVPRRVTIRILERLGLWLRGIELVPRPDTEAIATPQYMDEAELVQTLAFLRLDRNNDVDQFWKSETPGLLANETGSSLLGNLFDVNEDGKPIAPKIASECWKILRPDSELEVVDWNSTLPDELSLIVPELHTVLGYGEATVRLKFAPSLQLGEDDMMEYGAGLCSCLEAGFMMKFEHLRQLTWHKECKWKLQSLKTHSIGTDEWWEAELAFDWRFDASFKTHFSQYIDFEAQAPFPVSA